MTVRQGLAAAWTVPVAGVLVVAVWLLPFLGGGSGSDALTEHELGALLFQLFWMVWAVSIAVVGSAVIRAGRKPGVLWLALQCLLVVIAVARALPVLLAGIAAPVEQALLGAVLWGGVQPALVLLVSAVQGLLLFLAA